MNIDPAPFQKPSVKRDLMLAVRLAWDLGYVIAIPAVLFGFGGAYLDKLYGTSPLWIITGFVIAMALSGYGLYRKLKEILKK
jgi:F0F1-type ATP synthase assembly protein I